MTTNDDTPHALNVQIGALTYETIIAIQSVHAGCEMIARRPDVPDAMKEPLAILTNLAGRAVEASIALQDALWAAFGLSGVSDVANDGGNDVSG